MKYNLATTEMLHCKVPVRYSDFLTKATTKLLQASFQTGLLTFMPVHLDSYSCMTNTSMSPSAHEIRGILMWSVHTEMSSAQVWVVWTNELGQMNTDTDLYLWTVPVWSGLSRCPEGSVRDTEMSRFSANGPSWLQDGQRPTTHRPTRGMRPSLGLTGRAVIDSLACRTYDDVRCRCRFHWATYVVRRRSNLTLRLSIDRQGSVRVAYRW